MIFRKNTNEVVLGFSPDAAHDFFDELEGCPYYATMPFDSGDSLSEDELVGMAILFEEALMPMGTPGSLTTSTGDGRPPHDAAEPPPTAPTLGPTSELRVHGPDSRVPHRSEPAERPPSVISVGGAIANRLGLTRGVSFDGEAEGRQHE